MLAAIFENFSWSSFTVGAFVSWVFGKIAPVFLKEYLTTKRDKKKAIGVRCNQLCDAVHDITKSAANIFCLDYDREKSVKVKTDYHNIAVLITELNNDLHSFGFSDHQVKSKLIIDFRQAITEKILSPRTDRYNADDLVVLNIYDKSNALINCLREINRHVS